MPLPRRVVIASDHAGVEMKRRLREAMEALGISAEDLGTGSGESVDYPDYAAAVAGRVSAGTADAGVLVCGTGIGMSIAANKFPGVRAAILYDDAAARLSRLHNDANVAVFGARTMSADDAARRLRLFLSEPFEAGRHTRRIEKIRGIEKTIQAGPAPAAHREAPMSFLKETDPEIYDIIRKETERQAYKLELIASENFVSEAVLEATGSVLTNKYAEGYPGKRYYGGCEFVDQAESLAIERAKKIFGAEHVNVQPHAGSQANMAVYFSVMNPGDTMLGMNLSHGGHLTHGCPVNFSGKLYNVVPYGVREDTETIDYDQVRDLALKHRPKLIVVGASAYPRTIDFPAFRKIADEAGCMVMADIAHIAGMVAVGLHPSPVPYCEFVTTTTHKTLRGPRSGLIMCREEFAKKLDSAIFPGSQGGPLMHVIAAKAVALKEAMTPAFKEYQAQILRNAAAMAKTLLARGYRLVSGGTDNHLMLVNLKDTPLTGKEGEGGAGARGDHGQQEHGPLRDAKPVHHQRDPHRHARGHHPRDEGKGDGADRQPDRRRARRALGRLRAEAGGGGGPGPVRRLPSLRLASRGVHEGVSPLPTAARTRPDWDTYFMDMAKLAARRSSCLRRAVGAVLVKDRRLLATGYNGVPSGVTHCEVVGCLRERLKVPSGERHELCRGLHAEQNAIIQAAYHGVSIRDADLYCTNLPCIICAKMLINAGVRRIVYLEGYSDTLTREMLDEVGMELLKLTDPSP